MPRRARIDASGAVHHIMVRGIERKNIFDNSEDREHFVKRLGEIVRDSGTTCFAWSLMPNHFHLLLRTGNMPISDVMRRLLTGYAVWYNRRHQRHGHLFQNRFKSILCQEDAYLLELVRYIHLNPLRSGLVKTVEELDKYPYSGHSVLMERMHNDWQNKEEILGRFGRSVGAARQAYRKFVEEGVGQGRRHDLTGGGLIRSAGGWEGLKAKKAEGNYQRSDERILGDSDFVSHVLAQSDEKIKRSHALRAAGMDLEKLALHVSKLLGLKVEDVRAPSRQQRIVDARSLICYWSVRELGFSMAHLGREFGLSIPAISKSVMRGKEIAQSRGFNLELE